MQPIEYPRLGIESITLTIDNEYGPEINIKTFDSNRTATPFDLRLLAKDLIAIADAADAATDWDEEHRKIDEGDF